eukprot:gene13805-29355_t
MLLRRQKKFVCIAYALTFLFFYFLFRSDVAINIALNNSKPIFFTTGFYNSSGDYGAMQNDGLVQNTAVLIQYFENPHFVDEISSHLVHCMSTAVSTRIIVNIDDSKASSKEAWFRVIDNSIYRNITLVYSQNIHEIRAYNQMAAMAATSQYLFLFQDDDIPPSNCLWMQQAVAIMDFFPSLAVIGLNVAEVDGSKESRTKTSTACFPLNITKLSNNITVPFQFAATVDLGPMVVRTSVFIQLGGFDESLSLVGQPGIGLDFDLSWRVWRSGFSVAHMPVPFRRRQVQGAGTRNTQLRSMRTNLHDRAQRRISQRYHGDLRTEVRRK